MYLRKLKGGLWSEPVKYRAPRVHFCSISLNKLLPPGVDPENSERGLAHLPAILYSGFLPRASKQLISSAISRKLPAYFSFEITAHLPPPPPPKKSQHLMSEFCLKTQNTFLEAQISILFQGDLPPDGPP